MKKSLENELMSLAHSILKDSGHRDVHELKDLAGRLHEKLTILSFTEKYFDGPQPTIGRKTVEQHLLNEEKPAPQEAQPSREEKKTASSANEKEPKSSREKQSQVYKESPDSAAEEAPQKTAEQPTAPESDLSDIAVHYDKLPDFEPVQQKSEPHKNKEEKKTQKQPATPRPSQSSSGNGLYKKDLFSAQSRPKTKNELGGHEKSLNDRLNQGIKIGLNDRLAFIHQLFEGSNTDFNRVLSQLNTLEDFAEAKSFIQEQVKPDYNWERKEAYEERFYMIIEKGMNA